MSSVHKQALIYRKQNNRCTRTSTTLSVKNQMTSRIHKASSFQITIVHTIKKKRATWWRGTRSECTLPTRSKWATWFNTYTRTSSRSSLWTALHQWKRRASARESRFLEYLYRKVCQSSMKSKFTTMQEGCSYQVYPWTRPILLSKVIKEKAAPSSTQILLKAYEEW